MRALLRCDATASGGVGHLVRCLAVGEAARRRGWDVALAGSIEVPLARRLAEAAGIPIVPASDEDADGLTRLARDRRAQVLHVDHYDLTADLWPAVRGAGVVLSSMEDGPFGRRAADIVVDSALGAEQAGREPDGSARVLLGIRYAPLRTAVLTAREAAVRRGVSGGAPAVLVVLGGTDAIGVTATVVRMCAMSAMPLAELTVVAPEDRWPAVRASWTRPEPLNLLGPLDDLPALAAHHDVVVSAAGTTMWELACIGTPAALVAVTENQNLGYARAVAAGVAVGLGTVPKLRVDPGVCQDVLDRLLTDVALRTRLSGTGRELVDGLGADRIIAAWEMDVLTARPAAPSDAAALLAWRNDPATRAASRSTDRVEAGAHEAWLDAALSDPDRILLVVERAGVRVGMVRFDRHGPDAWEVSFAVAPEARGRGLAGRVLAAAEAVGRETIGDRQVLLAQVRAGNHASIRLLRAAGYQPDPDHGQDQEAVVTLVKNEMPR